MKTVHILVAVVVAAIWGFNFVVIKVGLGAFPPLLLLALRFVVAALPALVVPRPAMPWRHLLAIAATLFAGQFLFLFLGMAHGMPPGLASVTLQSQAFITVLIAAAVLRERPTARQTAGIVVACGGLAVIATTVGGDFTMVGLGLILISAASWATGNVLLRRWARGDAFAMMVWLSLLPPVPALAMSWAAEGGGTALMAAVTHATWLGWGAVLYLSAVATLGGFGLWSYLLRRYAAATVAPFSLLVPVFGATSAHLLLGEAFGPARLGGMVLILAGLAVVALPVTALRALWPARTRSRAP